MLTRIGGGMVRDIMLMEIPNVLRTELYGVEELIRAAVMVLGKMLNLPTSAAATTVAASALDCDLLPSDEAGNSP
jgi:uncharacterized membrane protein YeiH